MQFTTDMVRTLKGSALSIFVLLAIVRAPRSAEWLEQEFGWSDKNVAKALKYLEEHQYINRNGRYAWQIAGGFEQLPFMVPELGDENPSAGADPTPSSDLEDGTRKISESEIPGPLASSSSLNLESRKKNLDLARSEPDPENFRVAQNLAELKTQGIGDPKRSFLAKLEDVTPELIRYHGTTCKNRGQAIYRIENNWPILTVSTETVIQPIEHPNETGLGEDPVDEQAETWWVKITDRLRDHIPKADFYNFIPIDAPARHKNGVLSVLVCNLFGVDILKRHVDPEELDRMAQEISAGEVRSVQFVTQWDI